MKNPIPKSNFFATPTLEDLELGIKGLPAKDQALVWQYVVMAMNTCHKLVEDELAA